LTPAHLDMHPNLALGEEFLPGPEMKLFPAQEWYQLAHEGLQCMVSIKSPKDKLHQLSFCCVRFSPHSAAM
jgi:hypothetical protein